MTPIPSLAALEAVNTHDGVGEGDEHLPHLSGTVQLGRYIARVNIVFIGEYLDLIFVFVSSLAAEAKKKIMERRYRRWVSIDGHIVVPHRNVAKWLKLWWGLVMEVPFPVETPHLSHSSHLYFFRFVRNNKLKSSFLFLFCFAAGHRRQQQQPKHNSSWQHTK